ncbi:unnamed protein product [Brachionus calyciflorus]|uniref:C2H2-type domain-containing protein n=1 Tax=Brachionus calyciflorus TaxID=104777 RepID=A0A814ECV1_9BILA|nr:unnamed protein product [Brachionus calyciflorus]
MSNKENVLKCSNCTESFNTADSLLKHAQFYHNLNIYIENSKKNELKLEKTSDTSEQNNAHKDHIFIDVIPSDSNSMFLDTSKSYNITVSSSSSSSSSNVDTNNNDSTQSQTSQKTSVLDQNESTNSSCDSVHKPVSLDPAIQTTTIKKDESNKNKKTSKTNATFFCEICNAAFNQKIHLTKHTAKHTGIKPFKCSECNYSTVERSHLKVHVRVHTGEKPFKCTFCEYATAQSSTLKIHKKRHHDKQSENNNNNASHQLINEPINLVVTNNNDENCDGKINENLNNAQTKTRLDFKNLPPTKRFKNQSQLETMEAKNKEAKNENGDNNKLLGLANIALEREVDTKPPPTTTPSTTT